MADWKDACAILATVIGKIKTDASSLSSSNPTEVQLFGRKAGDLPPHLDVQQPHSWLPPRKLNLNAYMRCNSRVVPTIHRLFLQRRRLSGRGNVCVTERCNSTRNRTTRK